MRFSSSRIALPVLALAMGGLGFYHVNRESQTAAATNPPQEPARSPYAGSIAAAGVVEASTENIAIGAALGGLILEVYVPSNRVGTHVSAGQPLFRVDDRHLAAQLRVAEAQLRAAEARLQKLQMQPRPEELPPSLAKVRAAEANTARLKDQFDRATRLIEKHAVAQDEFVVRQREYEVATHEQSRAQAEYDLLAAGAWQPDIQVAEAAVTEAQAQVEQVKTEIARATVVSPVDGVVLQVNVRPGERVSEREAKPLVVLGDISTYHVRVDIDERDIARFHRGTAAKAFPRGETAHEITMRFARVEPFVVPKQSLTGENTERVDTRVLQVLYAITRADHPVYVGQQLDVFIDTGDAAPDDPGTLSTPQSSEATSGLVASSR
jgi:HlyD family secretion protein